MYEYLSGLTEFFSSLSMAASVAMATSAGTRRLPPRAAGGGLTMYQGFFGAMLLGLIGVLTYFELTDDGLSPKQMLTNDVRRLGGEVAFQSNAANEPTRVQIHFAGKPIADDDLQCLALLARVDRLDLARTAITDEGMRRLAELDHVGELDLSHTRVTDAGLRYLRHLGGVRKVSLEGTATTDAAVEHLTALADLEELNVRGTEISDAGLRRLASCTRLTRLHVGDLRPSPETLSALQVSRPDFQLLP